MENFGDINLLWILVSAFLVYMMQLGFSLVETGVVRSKNTINVAMKNLIDTVFGIIFFWIFGFGIMFGVDKFGLFGTTNFLIDGKDLNLNGFFFFQAMFAATAITIVSGAVAERIKFNGYIIVSIIVSSLVYPIFGHWAWNQEGWLNNLGFVDFAGSTVVHSIGAWVGLAGTIVLGPRLGKFKKGKITYFSPSNHNFIVFGVFVLFFAWFGFNAGSLLSFKAEVTSILLNTLLAGAFGGLSAGLITLFNKEKVGVEIVSFGVIAGLVGITAGCFEFNAIQSAFVGFISSFIMYYSDILLTKKLKIDDPVSAVSIHGFVGVWGTIAVGIFANLPENFTRLYFIYIQTLGTIVAFIFAFTLGILIFLFLKKINLLRVRKKHEILGLNRSEHNAKLPWVDTIQSITHIMKTGNIEKKIYEERDTEIGIVSRFFNYLLSILREKNAELKKSNTNLSVKAYHDNLTKILNRNGLLKRLSERNNKYILVIMDIDKFKIINDTYGHDIGDIVLKDLSTFISSNIRSTDIIARWGGEEFILILDTTDLYQAQNISDKLRIGIENFKFQIVGKVTISMGISEFKNEVETFNEVFKRADKALYQAKETGRNKVYVY
ncbi:ammonium transporter [Arcobacter lacus]|uniref:ammonium transporter n=1 Tax=Arcobacter lacus TaxID=1912876 RepID=UPI0021BAC0FB|nr:ammonium transporter [Arcobacter lacus]MCT7908460.1 ammonium transporter [Arcobacter lacus]